MNKLISVKIEQLHQEFSRDTYWTRVHLATENDRKTAVLAVVSFEYLWDKFGTNKITRAHLDAWIEQLRNKWSKAPDSVFKEQVHYDVYATSEEGARNGIEFLKSEVRP